MTPTETIAVAVRSARLAAIVGDDPDVRLVDDPADADVIVGDADDARPDVPVVVADPETTPDDLVAAIRAAVAGVAIVQPRARAVVDTTPRDGRLTPREREVLELVAAGLGNKQIAAKMNVSEHTVKFHLASIFSKLDAVSRTDAVTRGIQRGLLMV